MFQGLFTGGFEGISLLLIQTPAWRVGGVSK